MMNESAIKKKRNIRKKKHVQFGNITVEEAWTRDFDVAICIQLQKKIKLVPNVHWNC